MTRYYIVDPTAERGIVEVAEEEFTLMRGTDETRPYINKMYEGELALDDVPAELQEAVNFSVEARIARYGLYANGELTAHEALEILKGVTNLDP